MSKRVRESNDSQTAGASQDTQNGRQRKRARRGDVGARIASPAVIKTCGAAQAEGAGAAAADALKSASLKRKAAKRAAREAAALPKPVKRPLLPGHVKRLAVPKPVSLALRKSGSTKEDVNRRGSKISKGWGSGGFDAIDTAANGEDLGISTATTDKGKAAESKSKPAQGKKKAVNSAEVWVTRKTSYSAYMRSGLATFINKGHHTLILRAIGAAIPVCLSLGLAIREALPCGPEGAILEVRTGSIAINDEVVPNDDSEGEDMDIQYQVRTKSTVECVLTLKKDVRQRFLIKARGVSVNKTLGAKEMGVRPGRGGRGKPIRGGRGRGSHGHGAR